MFFTDEECKKATKLLDELGLSDNKDIVLIDARKSNKIQASKA